MNRIYDYYIYRKFALVSICIIITMLFVGTMLTRKIYFVELALGISIFISMWCAKETLEINDDEIIFKLKDEITKKIVINDIKRLVIDADLITIETDRIYKIKKGGLSEMGYIEVKDYLKNRIAALLEEKSFEA